MLDFNVTPPASKKKTKKKEAPAPAVVARDPFDITPIREHLKQYEVEIATWRTQASELQVIDDESLKLAVEMAAQAKRLGKLLEKFREEKKTPFRQAGSAIDKAVAVYAAPCEEIEKDILKPKINALLAKQKLERLEAERRAQEAAREMQAKLDAESAEKGLPQVEVPMPVLSQKAEPVRTAEGSASQRVDWKWELVNIGEVPREYLVLDRVAVNQAVRGGVRTIPGIRIFEQEGVQIRT